ncbi:Hypothetical protein Cul210932_1684 [Corynebacterium ulcerans]|nr:Hypothetical protein Cul210932_1684 [Corynebacterium ulcerans]ALD95405.1 Hypothetical protein Cul131001_1712 [Corynebacterium ulcerans]
MRVGVRVCWATVSRPTSVSNTKHGIRHWALVQFLFQGRNLARFLAEVDLPICKDRYSRRIVPTIFEPPHPFKNHFKSIIFTPRRTGSANKSYDSTHAPHATASPLVATFALFTTIFPRSLRLIMQKRVKACRRLPQSNPTT